MTTSFSHLHCTVCAQDIVDINEAIYLCPHCGGILETIFNYRQDFAERIRAGQFTATDVLPFNPEAYVYIGQGDTPLLQTEALSDECGVHLYLKCEHQNPTGSFKDRPVSCGISKAVSRGYKCAVVASSGNGAAAVAAFSAKAGLRTRIYVPESTPDEKVRQARVYGGEVISIPGPYSNSYRAALEDKTEGACNLTTTFLNPFTVDGDKVVAYELYLAAGVPDAIYVPIGAGPLLVGILKGYEELKELGVIDHLPRMVGVQAEGCSPVADAFESGERVCAATSPATIAGGICDGLVGYEQDGEYTLAAVRRSQGICVAVSDEEIRYAQSLLGRTEGVFVEPSSATAIAAIRRTARQLVGEGGKVIALLTGHGLKDMKNAQLDLMEAK
ncbi:MAG: threonine synthase [Sporomusa sp.]